KQGTGYRINELKERLRRILHVDRHWEVALVGAGDLGHALARYGGFRACGFDITLVFDSDPAKIGERIGERTIEDVAVMKDRIREAGIKLAMVAVPHLYMIVGLITPNEGTIYIDQDEITREPVYQRARKGIGYLAQEASVFRKLSVEDNIKAILEMSDMPREEQRERLEKLLDEFGLQKIRKSLGIQLSGGERRRTEIARALSLNPNFILLDEPFAGVDPIAVEDIQAIVSRLREKNIGILITDHNVHETLSITDRAYLLFEGEILKQGTAVELAEDEQVRRLYLGKNFELRPIL
ncbi:MAG: LPS export ABC transporter ATP-binding protein, partial [Bacteroidales bacterium]|nr:LPS export ABC transporter ATP-binding protein [Bacteroidales bacterium]